MNFKKLFLLVLIFMLRIISHQNELLNFQKIALIWL